MGRDASYHSETLEVLGICLNLWKLLARFLCTIPNLCIDIFHRFSTLEHVLFSHGSSWLSAVGSPAVISPAVRAIRDTEHLTEDGDVVLVGRKENEKSPRLKRAQCLLVKQAAWFHSNARHPSHSPKSRSSPAVSLPEPNSDFCRAMCKTRSHCRMRLALCSWAADQRSWALPSIMLVRQVDILVMKKRTWRHIKTDACQRYLNCRVLNSLDNWGC